MDECYIGETKRQLVTRISMHKRDPKSAVQEHCTMFGHSIIREDTVILNSRSRQDFNRKLREAIQIKRHQPGLNRDSWLYSPNAYNNIIS